MRICQYKGLGVTLTPEAYVELCQRSKILTVFGKCSIVDFGQSSEYAFAPSIVKKNNSPKILKNYQETTLETILFILRLLTQY